jgi:dihydroorotate dehydrogenase
MYNFLRPALFRLDAETAHTLGSIGIRMMGGLPVFQQFTRSLCCYEDPRLAVRIKHLELSNPIGLAAGFDKTCTLHRALPAFGFGAVEVGTVTKDPWPGNPRPRIFRFPKSMALVNRLGFPNPGVEICAKRLLNRSPHFVLGVNISKTPGVELERAHEDILSSYNEINTTADYVAINVSSPNTRGTRELQEQNYLSKILQALIEKRNQNASRSQPLLFVKVSPDLSLEKREETLNTIMNSKVDGLIIANTSTEHSLPQSGGVSGKPLAQKSLELLRWYARKTEQKLTLIASGGVFSAQDAFDRISAGASFVQIYTSWVYGGPRWVWTLNKGLKAIIKKRGLTRIQDAIGINI